MRTKTVILGAGVTGVAAGLASGFPIFESARNPGGICTSYYRCKNDSNRHFNPDGLADAYHFELGGGHWIFGGDPLTLKFLNHFSRLKTYQRHSAVFFEADHKRVPYPIQNHLYCFDEKMKQKIVSEIKNPSVSGKTMAAWLLDRFGPTLYELFFKPFNENYTAGLLRHIAPQDGPKSPLDLAQVVQGMSQKAAPAGYNVQFAYPEDGLNGLVSRMAERCDIRYEMKIMSIDIRQKKIGFENGEQQSYEQIFSTLPLNKMIEMTNLEVGEKASPYTSVLVLNLGAVRGDCCPDEHWIYFPQSRAGFHRVGFYSNVDESFAPKPKDGLKRVSLYIEKSYEGGHRASQDEIETFKQTTIEELKRWKWIQDVDVVDPTWIDVAYTWSYVDSCWREKAIGSLEQHSIQMIGRYGRWRFQGIAASIQEGLLAGCIAKGIISEREELSNEIERMLAI